MNSDVAALLSVLTNRSTLLHVIKEQGPLTQRQLTQQSDASQSTVSRSLQRLQDTGLIQTKNSTFALTQFGALILDRFDDLRGDVRHCIAAEPILRELGGEDPFTLTVLENAEVHVANPAVPDAPLKPLVELTNRAQTIEAVSAMMHESYLDVFRDRVKSSDLTAQFVVSKSVATIAHDEYQDRENLAKTTDQLEYYVTSLEVPYSLMRIRTPDDHYTTVTVSTDDTHGTIVSTNDDAWDWSRTLFERYKDAAARRE